MTRFFKLFLYTFLFSLTLASCSDPDDRNAYLSSLRLAAIWDETTEIMNDLEIDAELSPDFDPRTKTYTAKASCVTTSVNVLAFAAYPGLDLTVNGQAPESTTQPVNVPISSGETLITIYMSGDSFIETTYDITVTRNDVNDPPAIALFGGLRIDHQIGTEFNDPGNTACSATNPNLSGVVIGGDDVLTDTLGTYLITYDVNDTDGNELDAVQVIRTVNVVENTPPVITLEGDASVTVEQNADYEDDGATAQDAKDGDISADIDTQNSHTIDTSIIGTYTVTYDVTDADGASAQQVTRSVEVVVVVAP